LGDVAEATAIKQVFGERSADVAVCATKSMIGHSLGAAAAIEAVVLVQSLRYQKIHPSINIFNLDENCPLNIPVKEKSLSFNYGMSNSFGFGGHNSAVIFGLYT
jgi:3-oxoacyl-[acyl-carrier-protein] synthase II